MEDERRANAEKLDMALAAERQANNKKLEAVLADERKMWHQTLAVSSLCIIAKQKLIVSLRKLASSNTMCRLFVLRPG